MNSGELIFTSNVLTAGTKSQSNVAAALGSGGCTSVLIQNDHTSLVDLLVGDSSSQPVVLKPGENISIAVSNLNLVYLKSSSSTATVNYLARR